MNLSAHNSILVALSTMAAAWMVHVIWWRWKKPKNQHASLLCLFSITTCLFAVIAIYFCKVSLSQVLALELCIASGFMTYMSLYSLVEEQSPSLWLVRYLRNKKAVSFGKVLKVFQKENKRLLNKRIQILTKQKLIIKKSSRFFLTKRSSFLAQIFKQAEDIFSLGNGG